MRANDAMALAAAVVWGAMIYLAGIVVLTLVG
jgi:hypothetical protein